MESDAWKTVLEQPNSVWTEQHSPCIASPGGCVHSDSEDSLQFTEMQLPAVQTELTQVVVPAVFDQVTPMVSSCVASALAQALPLFLDETIARMKACMGGSFVDAGSEVANAAAVTDIVITEDVCPVEPCGEDQKVQPIEEGTPVILQGLEKAPALNGMLGFVTSLDSNSGRYIVNVEGHGIKRFERCNLIVEVDIDDKEDDESDLLASGCLGLDMNLLGSLSASSARH